MRVAYCSLLLPEEKKIAERTKERLSGISNHKVTIAEIKGIDSNLENPVDIFNIINPVNFPKFPQIVFKTEKWNHTEIDNHVDYHIGYINLVGIKYLTQYFRMYSSLKCWIKKLNDEQGIICVHNIFLPNMLVAVRLKKKYKNKICICLNTGDVPGKYGLQSQNRKNIKQFLIDYFVNGNIMKLAKKFDSFVFVTKEMATAFEVEKKPYVVVECAYTKPQYAEDEITQFENNKKTIFYAGSIREEYGICHLLRAFSMIKDSNYRLVICGGGPAEKIVKEYENRDSRIVYLGFVTPQEVMRQQQMATVLVSPREPNYEYVKYSFPSKSVDSLATGIPYVAHKLPCDPPEYENYINYAEDSDEGLYKKLVEICEMSEEQRSELGKKAQRFIIEEKNPIVMTREIITMWKGIVVKKND